MCIHHARLLAPVLLAAALSGFGCDDNGMAGSVRVGSVGPSPLVTAVNVQRGAFIQPAFIEPVPVVGGVCPTHPPFLAPFNITFHGDGRPDVFLSTVQMQFVDRAGVPGSSMTLGRAELLDRFGSTAIPPRGTRVFPFAFPFGCVGAPAGVLTVVVVAGDAHRRETSTVFPIPVR